MAYLPHGLQTPCKQPAFSGSGRGFQRAQLTRDFLSLMMALLHPQLWLGEGIDPVTSEQGETAVNRAWVLSAAGTALFVYTVMVPSILGEFAISPPKGGWAEILVSIVTLKYHNLYLFQPWVFPGIIGFPGLIIVPLLTYFFYRRNRAAAVLLLSFYVLVKASMFIWMYVFSSIFVTIWVVVSLLWGYVFFQGARGTFVHHQMKNIAPLGTSQG